MADIKIDINPSGRSNTGELTKWLKNNLESSLKRNRFNENLIVFKKDWSRTAASLYTKRSSKDFERLITATSLLKKGAESILAGNPNRTLATMTLKVEPNLLTSFSYDTHLGQVTEAGGSGKHRITRVAILKNQRKQVAMISKKNRSARFAGARDGITPVYKGRIKGFVPKGSRKIYIRLQPHTWKDGARLPIAQMYGLPNAYLLNSKRTKTAFNFDQRLKELWKP